MPFLPPNQQCQSTEGKEVHQIGYKQGWHRSAVAGLLDYCSLQQITVCLGRPKYHIQCVGCGFWGSRSALLAQLVMHWLAICLVFGITGSCDIFVYVMLYITRDSIYAIARICTYHIQKDYKKA